MPDWLGYFSWPDDEECRNDLLEIFERTGAEIEGEFARPGEEQSRWAFLVVSRKDRPRMADQRASQTLSGE